MYCKRLDSLLDQLVEKYPQKIKVAHKNFPVQSHKYAEKAARAALAAGKQGQFWPFHDKLFDNYNRLNDDKVREIVRELKLDAAIAYYGTRIHQMLDRTPRCPFQFHFGEKDPMVPPDAVEKIRRANSDSPLFVYPAAGHAFNNDARPSYHRPSAELARERVLNFLSHHL